jgi:hypothetical protein
MILQIFSAQKMDNYGPPCPSNIETTNAFNYGISKETIES